MLLGVRLRRLSVQILQLVLMLFIQPRPQSGLLTDDGRGSRTTTEVYCSSSAASTQSGGAVVIGLTPFIVQPHRIVQMVQWAEC